MFCWSSEGVLFLPCKPFRLGLISVFYFFSAKLRWHYMLMDFFSMVFGEKGWGHFLQLDLRRKSHCREVIYPGNWLVDVATTFSFGLRGGNSRFCIVDWTVVCHRLGHKRFHPTWWLANDHVCQWDPVWAVKNCVQFMAVPRLFPREEIYTLCPWVWYLTLKSCFEWAVSVHGRTCGLWVNGSIGLHFLYSIALMKQSNWLK